MKKFDEKSSDEKLPERKECDEQKPSPTMYLHSRTSHISIQSSLEYSSSLYFHRVQSLRKVKLQLLTYANKTILMEHVATNTSPIPIPNLNPNPKP